MSRAAGHGSVRNRGTASAPRWFAYYWVPIDPPEPMTDRQGRPMLDAEGRQRMRTRRQMSEGPFQRKTDAETWLADELDLKRKGRARVPTTLTVGQALVEWLDVRRHGLSPTTLARYEYIVTHRLRPHIGAKRLRDLQPADIARMLDKLRQPGANKRGKGGGRLSETTIQHALQVLHTALEWCVRQRYVPYNAAADVERPKRDGHEMSVWEPHELAAFLAHAEDDRLYPLWRLAAMTGVRRSEALALRWDDVDLDAATVMIRRSRVRVGYRMVDRETVKTDRGRRRVDLDAQTVAVLKRWRNDQRRDRLAAGPAYHAQGYLFTDALGGPLHADHVDGRFRKLVAAADGVPTIRFHDLRHTHATLLLNAGRPVHEVARRLGHSAQVLMSTYAHVLKQQGAEGAAAVAAVVDGTGGR